MTKAMHPNVVDFVPKDLYIAGAWTEGSSRRRLTVEDPATGEVLCDVADAEPADALAALDAASEAQKQWVGKPVSESRGEACSAANRFLVPDSLAREFAVRLGARMAKLIVGPGIEPASEAGPLIDATQRDKVAELVDDARDRGASVLAGGHALDGPEYFYAPTVLDEVPADARVLQEEIFGPVAPVCSFADEDAMIAAANDTEYGLAAYVYTCDLNRALRVTEQLDTGMIGLNQGIVSNAAAPFGGVKASGFGREGGSEGIDEYLETKYLAVASDA
jgi:succinate-semialdehyde dehydrogenase/glutarate-semialdehyde dehydrogenase